MLAKSPSVAACTLPFLPSVPALTSLTTWFTTAFPPANAAAPLPRRALHTGWSSVQDAKVFSQQDVDAFVAITGDHNPIHSDVGAAQGMGLQGAVLPGMLTASLFPALIGSALPGAVYLKQDLKFRRFATVGERLRAEVTVVQQSGRKVVFKTVCERVSEAGERQVVVEGQALALLPIGSNNDVKVS